MVRWSRCFMWWAVFESSWTLVCIIFDFICETGALNFNKRIYQTYLFRFDPSIDPTIKPFPIGVFFDGGDGFWWTLWWFFFLNKKNQLWFWFDETLFLTCLYFHRFLLSFNLISQHFTDGIHGSQFRRVKLNA